MSWRPTVDPERFRPHPTSPPHRPAHTPQPGGVRGADPGWAADGGRGVGDHAQGQQAATVRADFFGEQRGEGSVTGPANAQDKAAREPAARPRDPRSRLAAGPSRRGRGAQPEPPRGSRRETRKPSRSTPLPELLTGPPAPNLPGPTAVEPGRRPSPPPSTRPTYRRRRPTAATPSRKKSPEGPKSQRGEPGRGAGWGIPGRPPRNEPRNRGPRPSPPWGEGKGADPGSRPFRGGWTGKPAEVAGSSEGSRAGARGGAGWGWEAPARVPPGRGREPGPRCGGPSPAGPSDGGSSGGRGGTPGRGPERAAPGARPTAPDGAPGRWDGPADGPAPGLGRGGWGVGREAGGSGRSVRTAARPEPCRGLRRGAAGTPGFIGFQMPRLGGRSGNFPPPRPMPGTGLALPRCGRPVEKYRRMRTAHIQWNFTDACALTASSGKILAHAHDTHTVEFYRRMRRVTLPRALARACAPGPLVRPSLYIGFPCGIHGACALESPSHNQRSNALTTKNSPRLRMRTETPSHWKSWLPKFGKNLPPPVPEEKGGGEGGGLRWFPFRQSVFVERFVRRIMLYRVCILGVEARLRPYGASPSIRYT